MSTEKYSLIFSGEIRSDTDLITVKQHLATMFRLNSRQIEPMFRHPRTRIKSGLSLADAQNFKKSFEMSGALCEIEKESPDPPCPPQQRFRVTLTFSGDLLPGKDRDTVAMHLAQAYGMEKAKTMRLFFEKTVTVKKDTDFVSALKYYNLFRAAGASCDFSRADIPVPQPDHSGSEKQQETVFRMLLGPKETFAEELSEAKRKLADFLKTDIRAVDFLLSEPGLIVMETSSELQILEFSSHFNYTGIPGIIEPPVNRAHPEISHEAHGGSSDTAAPDTDRGKKNGPAAAAENPAPSSKPRVHDSIYRNKKPRIRRSSPAGKLLLIIIAIAAVGIGFSVFFEKSFKMMGFSKPAAKSTAGIQVSTTQFSDPLDFYEISLPAGFSREDSSQENISRQTFKYSDKVSLKVTARETGKKWYPEAEMSQRIAAIQSGRTGIAADSRILKAVVFSTDNAHGYRLELQKDSRITRLFVLKANDTDALVSINIVTLGIINSAMNRTLADAVENSLILH